MKKNIFAIVILFAAKLSFAQTGSYTLASVPEALKAKAAIVVHLEDYLYEMEAVDKAKLSVHKIFTIINKEGEDALTFIQPQNKNMQLDDAEIKVYDANGKRIARYTKKDMSSQATGEGLIEDGFLTGYRVSTLSYPVTIELDYKLKYKGTLSLPSYRIAGPKQSKVSSSFTARVPNDIKIRFKAMNTDLKPEITDNPKYREYKWSVKDLAPVEYEEGAVSASSLYPGIRLVAEQFSHYGYKGEFSSWKTYGDWLNSLNKGLDELPADRQLFYQNLVKDIPAERDKIKKLYQYMQQNFRYVSIQLGIGGVRPFPASFTDAKKYGDCKGLSTFMQAALKSVGIKSYMAFINSQYNEEPVDPEFPIDIFDHAILCVPVQNDSIWLECTSNTASFGVLGSSTENRNALLITENGGVLVPTPKSRSNANQFNSRTLVSIQSDFSASAETALRTTGGFREPVLYFTKEKRDRQKQALVYYWGFKQPDDFIWSNDDETAHLKLTYTKVHEFNSGDKYFLSPRLNKLWNERLPKAENRKHDYYFEEPFEKRDTTIYKLPEGTKPEALPKDKELKCDYGNFSSKCSYNESENAIYVISMLVLTQYKIPASGYAAVKKFFDDVTADDAQKFVVKKEETAKKGF